MLELRQRQGLDDQCVVAVSGVDCGVTCASLHRATPQLAGDLLLRSYALIDSLVIIHFVY